jgi:hypothetical protein
MLRSRLVNIEEVTAIYGKDAALCPATVAINSEERVCMGLSTMLGPN